MNLLFGVLVLAFGLAVGLLAVDWRFGGPSVPKARYLATMRRPGGPRVLANLHVSALPGSVGLVSLGVSMLADPGWAILGIAAFLAMSLAAVWFVAAPPRWAQAHWMIRAEHSGQWPQPPMSWFDKTVVLGAGVFFAVPLVVIVWLLASRLVSGP